MSETDPITKAAEALIAAGHSVEPMGAGFAFWIVDGKGLSGRELLAMAARLGLIDSPSDRQ
ncbi:hypothetical protein [Methylobacterium sp. yr668]|uniref:hypothetical protein n=1 Tax=Methylobacterium sp. yr668 TaxID=1761801 RepID=UPI0008F3B2B8|nr:hypothetical protein [Methylobacterium sp. yr668]SFT12007.1 hypothetical protein SAMN04487845_11762 [Methylobacterium sp. yr668]